MSKKFLSGLLAVTLCLTSAVPTFADTPGEIYEAYSESSDNVVVYSSESTDGTDITYSSEPVTTTDDTNTTNNEPAQPSTPDEYITSSDSHELYLENDSGDTIHIIGSNVDDNRPAVNGGVTPMEAHNEIDSLPLGQRSVGGTESVNYINNDRPETPGGTHDDNTSYGTTGPLISVGNKYDPHSTGTLTPLINQGPYAMCWAIATADALTNFYNSRGLLVEAAGATIGTGTQNVDSSDYVKRSPGTATTLGSAEPGLSYLLSPVHLAYYTFNKGSDPDPLGNTAGDTRAAASGHDWYGTGHPLAAANILTQGIGPVIDEGSYSFANITSAIASSVNSVNPYLRAGTVTRYLRLRRTPGNQDYVTKVKQAMMKGYGNPVICFNYPDGLDVGTAGGWDDTNKSYYESSGTPDYYNHAVEIVGWDDNKQVAVAEAPMSRGCWLIKNSHTTDEPTTYDPKGYFWLSYEEPSIAQDIFFFNYTDNYAPNIYQYDGAMDEAGIAANAEIREVTYANIFKTKANTEGNKKEIITHGTFVSHNENASYEVRLYVNLKDPKDPISGELVDKVTGHTTFPGMYNVVFKSDSGKNIVGPDTTFAIVVRLKTNTANTVALTVAEYSNTANWYRTTASIKANQSMIYYNDQWMDFIEYKNALKEVQKQDPGAFSGVKIDSLGNIKVKAYTSNLKDYAVTFFREEPEGSAKPYTQIGNPVAVTEGTTVTAPAESIINTSQRVLDHWYTLEGNTEVEFIPGTTQVNSDLNVYAKMKPGSYTLQYVSNYGQSSQLVNDAVVFGTEATIKANQWPQYDSSTNKFIGWNTQANGTGRNYVPGDKVTDLATSIGATVKLYAQWSTTGTATISYYKDNNVLVTKNKDAVIGQKIGADNVPVADEKGYTFIGWSRTPGGTVPFDIGNWTVTGNLDLFAILQPIHYTITIYKDKEQSDQMDFSVAYGETVALPNAWKDDLPGRTLRNYNTDAEGKGTIYNLTQSVKNLASEEGEVFELYAQWNIEKVKYTAILMPMNKTVIDKTFDYGTVCDAPDVDEDTVGYNLKGYFTDAEYKNPIAYPYTLNDNTTIYIYTVPIKYTVDFDPGSFETDQTMESLTDLEYGKSYTLTPCAFTRDDDEKFVGWNTKADGTGDFYKAGASIMNLTTEDEATVTMYARWSDDKVLIKFDTGDGEAIEPVEAAYGATFSEYLTKIEPKYKGYTFVNWYVDESLTTPLDKSSKVLGDTVLYAKWLQDKYNIKYNANGGAGQTTNITCPVTESYTLTAQSVSREGYELVGWNTASDGSGTDYKTGDMIAANTQEKDSTVTFYAQWDRKSCTVTFNAVGGESDSAQTVYYGEKVTKPENPTKDKYDFGGWYYNATCTRPVDFNEPILDSYTFYAKWTQDYGGVSKAAVDNMFDGDVTKIPHAMWSYGQTAVVEYAGEPATFETLEVYYYKTRLTENIDYTVKYSDNTSVTKGNQKAKCVIKGKTGDCKGEELTYEFIIQPWVLGTEVDGVVTNSDRLTIYDYEYPLDNPNQKVSPIAFFTKKGETVLLKESTDFTVTVTEKPTQEGTAHQTVGYITAKTNSNYTGKAKFNIVGIPTAGAIDIGSSKVTDATNTTTNVLNFIKADGSYEGVEPKIDLYYNDYNLKEDDAFTVEYFNNFNAGSEAYAVVTGKREKDKHDNVFYGTRIIHFNVKGVDISRSVLFKSDTKNNSVTYSGATTLPPYSLILKDSIAYFGENYVLVENDDYEMSLVNADKAGTAKVTYKGRGLFEGSKTKKYKISKLSLNTPDFAYHFTANEGESDFVGGEDMDVGTVYYSKKGAKPEVSIAYDGQPLIEGTDYTISYKNNKKVTPLAVGTIKGKGFFKGKVTFTYAIEGGNGNTLTAFAEDIVDTGKATLNFKPNIVVKDNNGAVLKAGKDYKSKITYSFSSLSTTTKFQRMIKGKFKEKDIDSVDTINPKTDYIPAGIVIKATILGKGNYKGTELTVTFKSGSKGTSIKTARFKQNVNLKTDEAEPKIDFSKYPVVLGTTDLVYDADYVDVIYSYKKKKGIGTVTIQAKDDSGYSGSTELKFTYKKPKKKK